MTLNEFAELVSAKQKDANTWTVELTLRDLGKSTLVIDNCHSEFDAIERAYLYLLDRIENKNIDP